MVPTLQVGDHIFASKFRHGIRIPFTDHTLGASRFPPARGEIVLFSDTFMDYFNPEVGKSAVRVLEALGYRVTLELAA